jgi:hypothetical protein
MKLSSFGVRFKPSWSIARLKAEIARKRNVSPAGLKIIFAGQELPDTITLGVTEIIIAWLYVYLSSYVILMLVYLLSIFALNAVLIMTFIVMLVMLL